MLLGCLVYAIGSLVFLARKNDLLDSEDYKAKYGNLYSGISINSQWKSKWTVFYFPIYLIRRLVFLLIPLITFGKPC
jgi:hypothetical protein